MGSKCSVCCLLVYLQDYTTRLPIAVLAQILRHVDQQQRLQHCALVSSTWASAAYLATDSISLKDAPAQLPSLQSWLKQHAQQLVSLQVQQDPSTDSAQLQLPCADLPSLQSLQLSGVVPCLQLPGVQDVSGSPACVSTEASCNVSTALCRLSMPLPRLASVSLACCDCSNSTIQQLSSIASITSLELSSIDTPGAAQQLSSAVAQVLQQLPRMGCLKLDILDLDESALEHLSTLQQLQELAVSTPDSDDYEDNDADARPFHLPASAVLLAGLPGSLTCLQLRDSNSTVASFELPPELPQLSGLQVLAVRAGLVPASTLSSLKKLQDLDLDACSMLPDGDEGTARLLAALARMSKLRTLTLVDCDMPWAGVPAQAFSALTTASTLQHLAVDFADTPPSGVAQHMFVVGRQLQSLTTLYLEAVHNANEIDSDEDHQYIAEWNEVAEGGYFLSAPDLHSIAAACPALETLGVTCALDDGASNSLLQLPLSCTSLAVGGYTLGDNDAAVIAQLTQLQDLNWKYSSNLSDVGLEQLTSLQRLQRLHVRTCWGLRVPTIKAAMGHVPHRSGPHDIMSFTLLPEVGLCLFLPDMSCMWLT